MDERISLLTTIFTERNEAEVAGNLSGDDAQTFIDMIDEVSVHTFPPRSRLPLKPPSHVG